MNEEGIWALTTRIKSVFVSKAFNSDDEFFTENCETILLKTEPEVGSAIHFRISAKV